jgi:undecaprenyl diphosphate synthase
VLLKEGMKENIDPNKIPKHIAVIMDGNGRWAKKQGAARIFGHQNAVKAVREVTEGCAELKVDYLTLYAFSTENWARPKSEVNGLMELLVSTTRSEIHTLQENNIRLHTIGDFSALPEVCQQELQEAIDLTKQNTGLTVTLALSYSGRWDITQAMKEIIRKVQHGELSVEAIDQDLVSSCLSTHNLPDPELLIRTSGEMRISNFLLWQIAYTELYISDILWPDFRKEHLHEAISSYQKRERRFGKISEQVKS